VLWHFWLGDRKGIRSLNSSATTVFLAHHDSLVAACSLQVGNTVIVIGGKLPWSRRARQLHNHQSVSDLSWQHGGSMLSPVSNTVIFQCFDTVGWVTGRASACKSSASTILNSLVLLTVLTWSNLTWNGTVKQKRCTWVCSLERYA